MKKGAKISKTKRNEISSHSSKKNAVSTQENSSNEITDFRNYDNNEFEELISNRITQYTTENINLLLMLNRAYYTNEFQKIERYIDSLDYINNKNLSKDDEKRLTLCFNRLSKLEYLYISLEDYYKSLQLQKRIINYVKKYIINN